MKRVLFLAHGVGRHEGEEWAQGEIELIQQKAAALEDDEETGFEKEKLQKAVAETVFKPLNYDDKYREYVAAMFGRKAELVGAMKQAGFSPLGSLFTDKPDEESVLRDNVFDILIYRVMKDHRNATRNHLMLQIYRVLDEQGVDVDEVQYSVMAHSLGTVVLHDTLQEMSIDDGSVYQLGNEFHVHSLFMMANTSALLQTNHDPRRSNVRPFIAPFDPGYVRRYYDFAHKFDPVAQFFSYKRYMRKEPDQRFTFVTVDHFLQANIHGYTHYLSDPRVYLHVLQGLFGRKVVPTAYAKKMAAQPPGDTLAAGKRKKLLEKLQGVLGDRLEPDPSDPVPERLDPAEVFKLVRLIAESLKELR